MNLKKKDLIVSVIMIVLFVVFGLTVVSNATSSITYNWGSGNDTNSSSIINQISTNTNTNISTTNTDSNISTVNTNSTSTNNNNNNNNNNTSSMPYTGAEDLPWVIITICGISAVFAYKKIKEYNID